MSDDNFPKITLDDERDPPPITFIQVAGWIRNALAGVGILACIFGIGFCSAR